MRIILLIALLMTAVCSAATPVIDVLAIAGKSESEVATYLGSPTSCRKIKYGEKCMYTKAETEIVFIDGRADLITVSGLDSVPFNILALEHLGLNISTPTFSNSFVIRWKSIQGLREVSIFSSPVGTRYAYIKVTTL